jgi:phosphate-selective porin
VKLDWYDPNTRVAGNAIGTAGSNFSEADAKYTTLGMGYIRYMNENLKLVFWYELIRNEKTALPEYTTDKKDNVLTIRAQFRF